MPHIIQICNQETVTATMADEAWDDFVHYAQGKLGMATNNYYGGSPDFVSPARTGGRDIIFVVMLHDSSVRTERDAADRNAEWLQKGVAHDMERRGYGLPNIGVLLHHGKSGWWESSHNNEHSQARLGKLGLLACGGGSTGGGTKE